ncbi:hypothetical protein J6590_069234 [Homalodisca vitripennis]|nr:hypothetical protein J6590_069234 [Homalodisca vitripennis]
MRAAACPSRGPRPHICERTIGNTSCLIRKSSEDFGDSRVMVMVFLSQYGFITASINFLVVHQLSQLLLHSLLCIDEFVCKQSKMSSRKPKEDDINEYFSRDNLSELSEDDGESDSNGEIESDSLPNVVSEVSDFDIIPGPSGDRSITNEPSLYESNNVNVI